MQGSRERKSERGQKREKGGDTERTKKRKIPKEVKKRVVVFFSADFFYFNSTLYKFSKCARQNFLIVWKSFLLRLDTILGPQYSSLQFKNNFREN